MGLFLDAAVAWNDLHNVNYALDVSHKGNLKRIHLSFRSENFPHLVGMQYAKDVDCGLRPAELYDGRLVSALLTHRLDDSKIELSRNWGRISGRLLALINLQSTLDGEFTVYSFNKNKVRGYSQLDAEVVIKNNVSNDIYFVFLDQ